MEQEMLERYYVSDCRWDGDDIEITLSPTSQAKYTVRIHDKESIKKAFELMRDRSTPVRDFVIDRDANTIYVSDNSDLYFVSAKNEGR
jgi:hypothetical protein